MKRDFRKLIRKNHTSRLTEKRNQLVRNALSLFMAATLIVSIIIPAIRTEPAHAELLCEHVHSEECYALDPGHVCSEAAGCEPVYPTTTVVVAPGHTHDESCYAFVGGHAHDGSCLDEESGELVCDVPLSEPQSVLICGLEESDDVTEEVADTDADPIGWICNAGHTLVCDHRFCTEGELCHVESGNIAFGGKSPKGYSLGDFSFGGDPGDDFSGDGTLSGDDMMTMGGSSLLSEEGNTIDVTGEINDSFSTLDAAIAAINVGPAGEYTVTVLEDVVLDEVLVINKTKDVTIESANGEPYTITQEGTAKRHFDVSGSLTLENIILKGLGNVSGSNNGGVNVNTGGNLEMNTGAVIKDCYAYSGGGVSNSGTFIMNGGTISGNKVGNSGGGVYNSGISALFTMDGGTISDNTASSGGGVYNNGGEFNMSGGAISGNTTTGNGGGINSTTGTFTLTGGTISGNTANNGGGVYNSGANASFSMDGGTISVNTASSSGGGVYNSGATASFSMDGGTISGNTAGNNGGGVYSTTGTFTLTGGTISGNKANNGGGVYAYSSSTFYMISGTISGNTSQNGGGVYINGIEFTMSGGTISGNIATISGGGGIHYADISNAKPLSISNATIINNHAPTGSGGGIYISQSNLQNLTVDSPGAGKNQTVFSGNTASKATGRNSDDDIIYDANIHTDNWSGGLTQGYNNFDISSTGDQITTYTVTFNKNHSDTGGWTNAVPASMKAVPGNSLGSLPTPPTREGYTFTGWNTATSGNGTVFTAGTPVTANITLHAQWNEVFRYIVTNDRDSSSTGRRWLADAVADCEDYSLNNKTYTITVYENDGDMTDSGNKGSTVTIPAGKNIILKSDPGNVYTIKQKSHARHFIVEGNLTLENIVLEGLGLAAGTNNNGGIQVSASGKLTMNTGAVIRKCYYNNGGGVYVSGTGSFTMSGGAISENEATNGGGVNFNSSGSFTLAGGEISGNKADFGGGVYATASGTFTVSGGKISGNVAQENGGGINTSGGLVMGNITISDNVAKNGGGVSTTNTLTVSNGTIVSGNMATYRGGGIYSANNSNSSNGDTTDAIAVNGGTISGNWTTDGTSGGGGIYGHDSAGKITISGGAITGNGIDKNGIVKTSDGGGIWTEGALEIATGGKVSGNAALASGGGIFSSNATASAIIISGGEISGNWTSGDSSSGGGIRSAKTGKIAISNGAEIKGNGMDDNGVVKTMFGGGISAADALEITTGGKVTGNAATGFGGGIYSTNSTASAIMINGGEISSNWTSGENSVGGGIYASQSGNKITIDGGTLINGNGIDKTSAVKTNKGGGIWTAGALAIISGTISGNKATSNGGGIFAEKHSALSIADAVIFSGNFAGTSISPRAYWLDLQTDGSYDPGGNGTGNSITIAALKALYPAPIAQVSPSAPPAGNGEFAYLHNNFDIDFVGEVNSNTDTDWNRLRRAINSYSATTITIYPKGTTSVTDNLAAGRLVISDDGVPPGGTYIDSDGTPISVARSVKLASGATGQGITLYTRKASDGRHFNITGTSTFSFDNVVIDGGGVAGGINASTTGTSIILNSPVIQNCYILGNGGAINTTRPLVINGGTFGNNKADQGKGGGIYAWDSLDIVNSKFNANNASQNGGGVWISVLSELTIDAPPATSNMTAFTGNTASKATSRLPSDNDTYAANIFTNKWSSNLKQGYNNYDIAYPDGPTIEPGSVLVTFSKNHFDDEGWTETNPTIVSVDDGTTLAGKMPAEPTRSGHVFDGWNFSTAGVGEQFTANTVVSDDITVYAQWAPKHTVTFDLNYEDTAGGSTGPIHATIEVGDGQQIGVIKMPTNPARPGYDFVGWNTKEDGMGEDITFSSVIEENMTAYAQWVPACTVTFDKNHSDPNPGDWAAPSPATLTAREGDPLGRMPTSPTRKGWMISGWNTEPDGSGEAFTGSTPVAKDITVYAQWREAFTVTFNSNHADMGTGGNTDANPLSKSVFSGGTLGTLPAPPTRTGWEFEGWKDGNGKEFLATTIVPGTMEVFAQWTPNNPITITFNKNHNDMAGLFTEASPKSVTMQEGGWLGALMPDPPTRAGYHFEGWNNQANGLGKNYDEKTAILSSTDMELFAKWKAGATVRYETDRRQNVKPGSPPYTLFRDASPLRVGYTTANTAIGKFPTPPFIRGEFFKGWKDHQGANQKEPNVYTHTYVSALPQNRGDYVAYGAWDQAVILTYDKNHKDPVGGNWTDAVPKEAYVLKNAPLTAGDIPHTNPTREGYFFNGWSNSESGGKVITLGVYSPPAKDEQTLYASWGLVTHDINYILGDGAKNAPGNPHSFSIRSAYPITIGAPTRPGYNFLGWNVRYNVGGTTKEVKLPNTFSIENSTEGDVVLTAIWSDPIDYSITYALNGGTLPAPPSSYNVTKTPMIIDNPTLAGMEFQGWTVTYDGSFPNVSKATKNYTIPKGATGNVALSASWSLVPYKIGYDLRGGTNARGNPTAYTSESAFPIAINNPNRTGYAFVGWKVEYLDSAMQSKDVPAPAYPYPEPDETYDVTAGTTGNIGFTAHWLANSDIKATFLANANEDSEVTGPNPATMTVTFDMPYGTLPTISRTGYTFNGWFTTASGGAKVTSATIVKSGGDHNLYAQWSPTKDNTLTYSANGANGGRTISNLTFDSPHKVLTISAANVTYTGHAFTGWNTQANGEGETILPGATYTIKGNATLYAQWVEKTSVTFKIISLDASASYETVWQGMLIGGKAVQPNESNPSGTGGYPDYYQAVLWYEYDLNTNIVSDSPWDFDNTLVVGDVILYAFDNVAWDSNSAVRTIDYGTSRLHSDKTPFSNILVRNSFDLGQALIIDSARDLTYHSLKGDVVAITASAANRHFMISGAGVSLTFADSKVALSGKAGNNGAGPAGGGIGIAPGAILTLNNPTIENCKSPASAGGGAVEIAAGATLNMSNGTLRNNYSDKNGGAVYNAGTFNMTGGTISSNTANLSAGNFGGGGVYNDGMFAMTGGTISGNTAIAPTGDHGGGGVYNDGTFAISGTATLANNTAKLGGGVYNNSTFNMTGGAITGNTGTASGGGVYNDGTFTMEGGAIGGPGAMEGNSGATNGGGVYLASGEFTFSDGSISGNNAASGGGAYYNGGTFTISESAMISGNTASSGGGLYAAKTLTISAGKISGNKADINGGGIYFGGANSSDSLALGGAAAITGNEAANGGGVFLNKGILTINSDADISGNNATNGGGIAVGATGGAPEDAEIVMNSGAITENEATNGGGIYVFSGSVNMAGGAITGNEATNGGGVWNGGSFEMSGSATVGQNIAYDNGGGVWNNGSFKISGSSSATITSNYASLGGGVFNTDAGASAIITGGAISGNAALFGGGIHNSGSITVTGGAISSNTASVDGGGIYQNTDEPIVLGNVAIVGNSASGGDGGGVWIAYGNLENLEVTSSATFSGNTAFYDFMRMSEDDDTYETNIALSSWSTLPAGNTPVQGYNNYDIAYTRVAVAFDKNHDDLTGWTQDVQNRIAVDFGKPILSMPTIPTRNIYEFVEWNTSQDGIGGSALAGGGIVLSNRKITYYAQWVDSNIGKTYTISGMVYKGTGIHQNAETTFTVYYEITDADGKLLKKSEIPSLKLGKGSGTAVNVGYVIEDVPHGANVRIWLSEIKTVSPGGTFQAYPRERSIFSLDKNTTGQNFTYGTDATYGVIYKAPGSLGPVPVDEKNYTKTNDQVSIIFDSDKIPVKPNEVFIGWNTNASSATATYQKGGTMSATFGVLSGGTMKDAYLYAIWGYEVTYFKNDGTQDKQTLDHTKGQLLQKPADFTRKGYSLVNWNTVPNGIGGTTYEVGATPVNGKLTLYAQWEIRKDLKVTFDKNAGTDAVSGMPNPLTMSNQVYGATISKPIPDPVREGYNFGGWSKKASSKDMWNFDTDTIEDDTTTLFAIWEIKTYTVTYNSNTDSPTTQTMSHNHGSALQGPAVALTYENHRFKGWNTDPNGDGDEYTVGSTLVKEALTLYAQWVPVYTVTFNIISLDGVTGTFKTSWSIQTEDKTITMPNPGNPSGEGGYPNHYQAAMWHTGYNPTTNDFTGKVWDFSTDELSSNLDLYAFDNVIWDTTSAKRAMAHNDFGTILVRDSFTLTETLNNFAGRIPVTLRNIDGENGAEKSITTNITTGPNRRHININSTLTLTSGITLTNYSATQLGGGVDVGAIGTFNMLGGKINGNNATNGGGVYVANGGTLTMSAGEISGNTATGEQDAYGGGVYMIGDLDISGGKISNNTVTATSTVKSQVYGGGIYIEGKLDISGSVEISGNKASGTINAYGGGIYVTGDLTISGSVEISENEASSADVTGGGRAQGGGAYVDGGAFEMDGGIIEGNKSTSVNQESLGNTGGGVYFDGTALTMTSGTISGNEASHGGGVYVNEGSFTMDGGKINGNKAISANYARGGGVFFDGLQTFTMTGGEINDNEARALNTTGTVTVYGGGVAVYSNSLPGVGLFKMEGGTISGNDLKAETTGTIIFQGGGVYLLNSTFELDGGTITDNTATAMGDGSKYLYGGGVYSKGDFTMNSGKIAKNTATATNSASGAITINGGGVYSDGNFTMQSGEITDNTVTATGDGSKYLYGGGVFSSGNLTIISGDITDNKMTGTGSASQSIRGGGVYFEGSSKTLSIEGGTISRNVAMNGGGIFVLSSDFTMSGGTISGNTATVNGGGIFYTNSGEFTMTGGTISGNEANSGGGVLVNTNSSFTMTDGTISGNKAAEIGGGVYNRGSFTMTDGTISGNEANNGGGVYTTSFANIAIGASAVFSGNTADSGAYWLDDYVEDGKYNPGTEITVGDLKSLHGSGESIKTTALSDSPNGNVRPFAYLVNNYDLNFDGTGLVKIAPTLVIPESIDYGIGTVPTKRTLYGLRGSLSVPSPANHVVNDDAFEVSAIKFEISNPKNADWSLKLHCTPFLVKGIDTPAAEAVAVARGAGNSVTVKEGAFYDGAAITVYSRSDFLSDVENKLALYDTDNDTGTWTWDRLTHDIKVAAEPGKQIVDNNYVSEFTWTLTIGP